MFKHFLISAALLLPPPVFAQTDAENITVTATRAPSPADDVPAGVTVIDRATIDGRGYLTIVDALAAVPGVRVVQSGGPGSVASVFVRGANSNGVLVLRDGVPVNDPGDPGGAFNFGVDTIGDVERIEIVRGPMSALWGAGAVGGVINIVTRRGAGALHGSVTVAGGAPAQGLVRADASGRSGPVDVAVNLEATSLEGFDQTPARESVYTGERDGDRNKGAEVEIGVTPVEGTRVSLLLRGRDDKSGYDEQDLATFDAANASGYDSTLFGRLALDSALFGDVWHTTLFVSRLADDRRYRVEFDALDPNALSQDDRYHGRRTDAQWNNTVRLPDVPAVAATNARLVFGYEHGNETADTSIDYADLYGPYLSTTRAHADTDSGWAEMEALFDRRLTATASLREDATTIAGDAFTWRVGAVLAVPDIASRFHAAYGTAFRAPALFDRYGVDSFGYRGNPDLRPERSEGWEVGDAVDVPLPAGASGTVTVTYFDNRIRDLITFVFSPVDTVVNVGAARTRGVESELALKLGRFLSADLTYTYTDARNADTNALLARRPLHQASADVRVTPWARVEIVPELLYVGPFEDYLVDNTGMPSAVGLSRSGLIFNLNARWQATERLALFVWAKNLGGSTFEPANGYQTPGASFLTGTRITF